MKRPSTTISKENRIFVNRTLNFANIQLIGFDMDHTLAPYHRSNFEALAFKETLKKFINAGYPEELSQIKFKPNFVQRGLLVDRERGNILKVNGHKYVKNAYHGFVQLNKKERYELYNHQSFKAQNFLSIDTFFALSEVQLFLEIVNFMDLNPSKIQKSYSQVYNDLRHFIDLCHKDGSIKNEVNKTPEKYIIRDKHLPVTLQRLLDAGKSLFLLTNSNYDYTNNVMTYLFDGTSSEFSSWKDYWDIVIVGAAKPSFFFESQPFFEIVEVENENLLRIHDGPFKPNKIYHGGNAKLFEKLNGYVGDEVLYVGDHIYGDIIQSKGSKNWRTLLIVEELEEEIPKLEQYKNELREIYNEYQKKEGIDEDIQVLKSKIAVCHRRLDLAKKHGHPIKSAPILSEIKSLEEQIVPLTKLQEANSANIKTLFASYEEKIHPVWGQLMKVGVERSRFANQIASYACLYTSRVSNLRFYNFFKKFVSFHEVLPHEDRPE